MATHNLDDLKTLLLHELKDLYDAEHQIVEALPKMTEVAQDARLKQAFEDHTRESEGQIKRLESVFALLDAKPERDTCKAMQGLIKEGKTEIKAKGEPVIHDLALIAAAQRVEHYEIAGYGAARTMARMCNESKAADLLQETLDEEGATDKKLTSLAENLYQKAA
jgi:ferritin-like metal-binding protein YciE